MIIAVNLLNFKQKIGGAGNYALNLLENLFNIDTENTYLLFVNTDTEFVKFSKYSNCKIHTFDIKYTYNRILFEQFIFPFILYYHNIELLFSPSVSLPFLFFRKKIVTIHDLLFKTNKIKYPYIRRLYISVVTYISVKISKHIFTVSEKSKNEILNEYKISQNKISITYNSGKILHSSGVVKEQATYLPFFLYVGAIEPGKNIEILIDAYSIVKNKFPDIKYYFTMGLGWQSDKIIKNIKDKLGDSSVLLSYQTESDIQELYKNTLSLVYLSIHEGFGLPVIEYMFCGKRPIVPKLPPYTEYCSNINSIFIEKIDVETVAKTLESIYLGFTMIELSQDELKKIQNKINWNNSAMVVYNVIKSLS